MSDVEILLIGLLGLATLVVVTGLFGLEIWLQLLPTLPADATDVSASPRSLSIIVPVHGSAATLPAKLASLRGQHWPDGPIELILSCDGPVPDLPALAGQLTDTVPLRVIHNPRQGKFSALNAGVAASRGELLVFSDLDARLADGAIAAIVSAFGPADVGAACGRTLVDRADALMQAGYWDYEARLKAREQQRLGSITAANGTLLAIRREFFVPIVTGVVDDLYIGLSAVAAGTRFVFAGDAVALMHPPGKTLRRVFQRQRRIVARGLALLWVQARLLSPRRHGRYAVALLLHKVLRRLVPLALVLGLLVLGLLAALTPAGLWSAMFAIALALLLAALGLMAALGLDRDLDRLPRPFGHLLGVLPWALCVHAGILLGWLDVLRGRQVSQW